MRRTVRAPSGITLFSSVAGQPRRKCERRLKILTPQNAARMLEPVARSLQFPAGNKELQATGYTLPSAFPQQLNPALASVSFSPFMLARVEASETLIVDPAGGTPPCQCVSRLTA